MSNKNLADCLAQTAVREYVARCVRRLVAAQDGISVQGAKRLAGTLETFADAACSYGTLTADLAETRRGGQAEVQAETGSDGRALRRELEDTHHRWRRPTSSRQCEDDKTTRRDASEDRHRLDHAQSDPGSRREESKVEGERCRGESSAPG